jgi:hypothetical protein
MFSFRDGRKEPGICINKYNIVTAEIDYYFIPQYNMQEYKTAFDRHDKEKCKSLSMIIKEEDILNIRPVSLSDYKMIMELVYERNQQLNLR